MVAKRKFIRPPQRRFSKDHIKWTIKRGRSVIGATYELSNGDLVYLARRWRGEIFCCGEPTISAAMAKGIEEWAFDHSHLLKLKFKGVKWVGVIEREKGGTLYLTTLDVCMDKAYYQMRNYAKVGGELQHYINHRHFMKLTGTTTF